MSEKTNNQPQTGVVARTEGRTFIYDTATGVCKGVDTSALEAEAAQKERERNFKAICDTMLDLYHRKNMDYGNSFGESYREFGLKASIIRLGDKYRRLKSLEERQALVGDESIQDTLLDMANYAIMTLVEMK